MICTLCAELLHGRSGRPTGRPIEILKGSSNLNLLKSQLVYQLVYPTLHLMQILRFLLAKTMNISRLANGLDFEHIVESSLSQKSVYGMVVEHIYEKADVHLHFPFEFA